MKVVTTPTLRSVLGLSLASLLALGACGRSPDSQVKTDAQSSEEDLGIDLRDADYYATVFNVVFAPFDIGVGMRRRTVTFGTAGGSTKLSFSSMAKQADGTYAATMRRYDKVNDPQEVLSTVTLRKVGWGKVDMTIGNAGQSKETVYEVLDSGSMSKFSFRQKESPAYRNGHTGGNWQVEIATVSSSAASPGKAAYRVGIEQYRVAPDYVAEHYEVVEGSGIKPYLRDKATGEQLSVKASEIPALVAKGVLIDITPPGGAFVWKELAD